MVILSKICKIWAHTRHSVISKKAKVRNLYLPYSKIIIVSFVSFFLNSVHISSRSINTNRRLLSKNLTLEGAESTVAALDRDGYKNTHEVPSTKEQRLKE